MWTDVNEAMPDINTRVLVYTEYSVYGKYERRRRGITIGEYDGEKWKCANFLGNRVIAWMPLPKAPVGTPSGCWNCRSYDYKHEACTINWNNMDESYYNPYIDDRKPDDHCEYWELNPDAKWEDWH